MLSYAKLHQFAVFVVILQLTLGANSRICHCSVGGAKQQWLQLHADTEYILNVTLSRINRQQVNCIFKLHIVAE